MDTASPPPAPQHCPYPQHRPGIIGLSSLRGNSIHPQARPQSPQTPCTPHSVGQPAPVESDSPSAREHPSSPISLIPDETAEAATATAKVKGPSVPAPKSDSDISKTVRSGGQGHPGASPLHASTPGLAPPRCKGPGKSKLMALPLEMVLTILKNLSLRHLLCVRMTCTYLRNVSYTRGLWEGLYRRYVKHLAMPFKPEEPISSYTQEELEKYVVLRVSAEFGWISKKVKRPTRQRRLDWGLKGDVIGWNLVQGGRWLLIGGGAHPGVLGANGKMDVGEDGEVVLCDLEKGTSDNTMLVQKLIIPTCEKDKQNVHGIATDVDESQERLTFNVALTLWSYNGSNSPFSVMPRARFWKATLEGHGAGAQLKAKFIKSFHTDGLGYIMATSLRGRHFAQALGHYSQVYIEVLEWPECSSVVHKKTFVWPSKPPHRIELLSESKVLVFTHEWIALYTIPSLERGPALCPHVTEPPTKPDWRIPCHAWPVARGGASRVWRHPDGTIRCSVCTGTGVYGLVIPGDFTAPVLTRLPQFLRLLDFHPGHEGVFAMGRSIGFVHEGVRGGAAAARNSAATIATTASKSKKAAKLITSAPSRLTETEKTEQEVRGTTLTFAWGGSHYGGISHDPGAPGVEMPPSHLGEHSDSDTDAPAKTASSYAQVATREYPGEWSFDAPLLDEPTGRLIQWTKERIYVLDSALCYMKSLGASNGGANEQLFRERSTVIPKHRNASFARPLVRRGGNKFATLTDSDMYDSD